MATGIYEWKDKKPLDAVVAVGSKDPATPTALQTPSTPSFGDLLKSGSESSGPTPSFSDLFSGVGEVRSKNVQGAQEVISQGLNPSTPSAGSQLARNAFIKAGNEAERKVLEQSALGGRADTGQIVGDRREFLTKTLLPQRMDFEAQLQAQEEQQAQARQQAAVGNVLAMEGLGEQGRATDAGNALAARGQDIAVRGQDIQDRQASAALEESKAGRIQQAAEGALDRALQKYITDSRINLDSKQLAENIRQFDSKLAFDEWATKGGFEQQEKDRLWDAHLQDLQQKWSTGERLGAQDHQVLIEDKRIKAQTAAQEFDKLTQLEVLGKTQDWERAKLELTNTYQTLRDQQAMSHEEAMTLLKGDIETRLTQMGVDAQTARQAADIEAQKWNTERQIAHESAVANAELMYKYESLRTQKGLEQQRLNQSAQQIANQAAQFAQSFGLDEQRIKASMASEANKDALGELTVLQELAGDNPDMQQLASNRFVDYLRTINAVSPETASLMKEEIARSAGVYAKNQDNLEKTVGSPATTAAGMLGRKLGDFGTWMGSNVGGAISDAADWLGDLF